MKDKCWLWLQLGTSKSHRRKKASVLGWLCPQHKCIQHRTLYWKHNKVPVGAVMVVWGFCWPSSGRLIRAIQFTFRTMTYSLTRTLSTRPQEKNKGQKYPIPSVRKSTHSKHTQHPLCIKYSDVIGVRIKWRTCSLSFRSYHPVGQSRSTLTLL